MSIEQSHPTVKVANRTIALNPDTSVYYYPSTGKQASKSDATQAARILQSQSLLSDPIVVGTVVLNDSGYTGQVTEIKPESDLAYVKWHKWGDEFAADNATLDGWEMMKRLVVVKDPIQGQWWPKHDSDKPEILVKGESNEFEDFRAMVEAKGKEEAVVVPTEKPEKEDLHSYVKLVLKHLPREGEIDQDIINQETKLGLDTIRTALTRLKRDGFVRYEFEDDKFYVISGADFGTAYDPDKAPAKGKTPKAKKEPKVKEASKPCACGCGALTKNPGAYFCMGHDARAKGTLIRVLDGEITNFTPTDRLADYVSSHPAWWDRFHKIFDGSMNQPVAETVEGLDQMDENRDKVEGESSETA